MQATFAAGATVSMVFREPRRHHKVKATVAGATDAAAAKLVTTELPRMRAGRVHPRYRILVETGRTSSHGNKKTDKNPAYPAVNIQQIDPRVRPAYVPSPGHVLCAIDYSFIELVSAAQKCIDLFGRFLARFGNQANETGIAGFDIGLQHGIDFGCEAGQHIGLARKRRSAHPVALHAVIGEGLFEGGNDREDPDRSGNRRRFGKDPLGRSGNPVAAAGRIGRAGGIEDAVGAARLARDAAEAERARVRHRGAITGR